MNSVQSQYDSLYIIGMVTKMTTDVFFAHVFNTKCITAILGEMVKSSFLYFILKQVIKILVGNDS